MTKIFFAGMILTPVIFWGSVGVLIYSMLS
ncbi:hypothetical protein RLEG12_20355 [Rhizobium leguminosarum bv. trifolii CB782]|nr:hypothetical protein RLEG12_20355 [Rhizobium leguminosarum bv. trifolii CB782]